MSWSKVLFDSKYWFFPLRVVLPQQWLKLLALPTLAEERASYIIPFIKGSILDIGCGENLITANRKQAVGVDVFRWPSIDCLCDTTRLPFGDNSFDTVTMMACLNHVPRSQRNNVLSEVYRVLKPNGQILITMIDPKIGWVCHKLIAHWDTDQTTRGIKAGEEWGLAPGIVIKLLFNNNFKLQTFKQFSFCNLNTLYIARNVK